MVSIHISEEDRNELAFMLRVLGSHAEVWKSLQGQFAVLNQRSQAIFGIGVLTISVTGFSGHRIVAAGMYSGIPLIVGLICVLLSLSVAMYGVVRLHWMSQMRGDSIEDSLSMAIAMRNRKTRFFRLSLKIVLFGLTWYVMAVVNYLYQAAVGGMPLL